MSLSSMSRSAGLRLDKFFFESSGFVLWAGALIAGLVLLYCASFLHIGELALHSPLSGPNPQDILKDVGIWYAPNWAGVYLLLFPLYLLCASCMASQIRNILARLTDCSVFVFSDGRVATKDQVTGFLDGELKSAGPIFAFLLFAVFVVAAGGWYASCGSAILDYNGAHLMEAHQLIDWSTGAILKYPHGPKIALLIYSLIAYIWMGFALFIFLACLFLGCIYALFLRKFADGQYQLDGVQSQMLSRPILPRALAGLSYNFFIACFLGFVAAFFMKLQTAYLVSPRVSLYDYWFQAFYSAKPKSGALDFQNLTVDSPSWIWSVVFPTQPDAAWQWTDVQNQTVAMSIWVVVATMVCLAGTLWQIGTALKAARQYTQQVANNAALLNRFGADITLEENDRLQSNDLLSPIFPNYMTSFSLAALVILCTLIPRLTLVFTAVILAAIVKYLLKFSAGRQDAQQQNAANHI